MTRFLRLQSLLTSTVLLALAAGAAFLALRPNMSPVLADPSVQRLRERLPDADPTFVAFSEEYPDRAPVALAWKQAFPEWAQDGRLRSFFDRLADLPDARL